MELILITSIISIIATTLINLLSFLLYIKNNKVGRIEVKDNDMTFVVNNLEKIRKNKRVILDVVRVKMFSYNEKGE
jgi:hypothetical protein|nr:MAG TPA: hypothetical protein [Caudoviricetes sp.]